MGSDTAKVNSRALGSQTQCQRTHCSVPPLPLVTDLQHTTSYQLFVYLPV